MDVKELLMQEARKNGICEDGYNDIRCCKSVGELLDYYKKNIDWSLENNYPNLQEIRKLFSKEELEKHGIFIDKEFEGETLSTQQAYVFHNCKGYVDVTMNYETANIPMLYFSNGCKIDIYCGHKNVPAIKVPIYIFGENDVECFESENVKFIIYRKEVKA